MSETQNWQEQLQQKVGDLLARRIGTFAEELQQVQASLGRLCERLPETGFTVTEEEATGLQQHFQQVRNAASLEAESDIQGKIDEAVSQTESRLREQYEQQIQDLRAQLSHQSGPDENSVLEGVNTNVGAMAVVPRYAEIKAAITDIDSQRQQADVLSALVRHASHFAPRVLFLVFKGGHAIGWKATGFINGLTDETSRSINIPADANKLLEQVANSAQTVDGSGDCGVLGAFSSPAPTHYAAIPLVIRGKVAAVLYADSIGSGELITEALEGLMQVTGMAIELLPLRKTAPAAPQVQAAAATQQSTMVTPAPVAPPVAEAVPVQATPEPVPTVQAFVQEQPVEAPPATSFQPTPPSVAEITPPAVQEAAQSASGFQAPTSQPATTSTGASDDDVRAHNDARRFARLLVSEIKLYNEQKVQDGRRSNDLYERLKEDIDRSRQMYEKRVSANVAGKFDYFYDELLHTLAEGDSAKLGRGCPGPTVPIS